MDEIGDLDFGVEKLESGTPIYDSTGKKKAGTIIKGTHNLILATLRLEYLEQDNSFL